MMRKAYVQELSLDEDQSEKDLQQAIRNEIDCILKEEKSKGKVLHYVIMESFGLDIAIFIDTKENKLFKCIEIKLYKPSSMRIGVGNQRGEGRQIDILLLKNGELELIDKFCRWIIADSSKSVGSNRYIFCNSSDVKTYMMGGVKRGKQNNINPRIFDEIKLFTWDELSLELEKFLLDCVNT